MSKVFMILTFMMSLWTAGLPTGHANAVDTQDTVAVSKGFNIFFMSQSFHHLQLGGQRLVELAALTAETS